MKSQHVDIVLTALICVCVSWFTVEARRLPPTTTTTDSSTVQSVANDERDYHPAVVEKPRLIEQFDHRHFDGHYEYGYVLSNGDARYERSYWIPVGDEMVLARKGYYSYPLPNHQFHTVFYTADHNGFHQLSSKFSKVPPVLPRHLDAPEHSGPVAPQTTPFNLPRPTRPSKTQTRTTPKTIFRRSATMPAIAPIMPTVTDHDHDRVQTHNPATELQTSTTAVRCTTSHPNQLDNDTSDCVQEPQAVSNADHSSEEQSNESNENSESSESMSHEHHTQNEVAN